MRHLVTHYTAGQVVPLRALRENAEGTEPLDLSMTLRAFVRHPGDLELPYEDVEIESDSGYRLKGWFIPPPERSDGRVGISSMARTLRASRLSRTARSSGTAAATVSLPWT